MAGRMGLATLVLAVVAAAVLPESTSAATYVVGDSLGWMVPSGGAAAYSSWASQHTFTVGDTLIFNFLSGVHDVARVTKEAYDGCNSSGPISLQTVGPANFTLNSTGEYYFFCTFGQHCVRGQKLAINVTSGGPTASPPASPPASPAPIPSPTPTPTPAVSPPPPAAQSPPRASSPSPAGTTSPPPPPTSGSPPSSSPSPGSPPSDTTQSPPPPPPPSSAPPKAAATFMIFLPIVIGLLY